MSEFEPQIVAFFCNWCTFTGSCRYSRLSYPPNLRSSGLCAVAWRSEFVLKAFLNGVMVSLIGGCWPGDCH
jgi:F420-non-reducing hydrogenase iron-sulfur subunit